MKKIISLLLSFALILTFLSVIASCKHSFLCFDICNAWLSGEDIKLLSQPEKQRLCGF